MQHLFKPKTKRDLAESVELFSSRQLEAYDKGVTRWHFPALDDRPKPEALIRKILHISTNPGDLVLDAYLGSGTTAAVAHKMGRTYIGIENGEHIHSHCVHRLQKVIAGESGGISELTAWRGGGGFDFYRLNHAGSRRGV